MNSDKAQWRQLISAPQHLEFTWKSQKLRYKGFPGGSLVKIPSPVQETWVPSLTQKIPHAKEQLSLCATATKTVP